MRDPSLAGGGGAFLQFGPMYLAKVSPSGFLNIVMFRFCSLS